MASFLCICSFFFFFFFITLCPSVILQPAAAVHSRCKPINAIYSFGDSIADTGNLIREGAAGNFAYIRSFPYGETTFRKATGRCSNGLLIIDYLALASNLPLLEPSLDKGGNFSHGINFAVAGATALDKAFYENRGFLLPFTNSSLTVQIQWFKTHLNSICSSRTECKGKLKNSLFMLGEIGGNDYNYAFLGGKLSLEVMTYVPHVVESIIEAAEEVIRHGATHIVVPGNFPIGCIPIYLTAFAVPDHDAYDEHGCLIGMNDFASFHNEALMHAMDELRISYPHVLIIYADYYNAFMNLLNNAKSLGFDENSLLKACCGSGGDYNFDIARGCGAPGTNLCENPAKLISWDGIHLTQEAYRIMARELIRGGYSHPSHRVTEKCER